jgi:hypothetical protein
MRSEDLMEVNRVMVFWDATPYSLGGRYEHFKETAIWQVSLKASTWHAHAHKLVRTDDLYICSSKKLFPFIRYKTENLNYYKIQATLKTTTQLE